jgi:CheY-like chemotaxis protein
VLERNNYATILASDGPEALSVLEKEKFDIIITDLEMPKMHGFELIEKIREQEKYSALPIVILTGRVGKEHKDKGMQLGANAYIVKPFKENDLVKTLENFIDYSKE